MSSSKSMIPFLAELLTATAASYVLSQVLKSYMNEKPFLETFDIPAFTDFILFNLFKVPVSTAWNAVLDDLMDEKKAPKKEKGDDLEASRVQKPIKWKIVLYKLLLNQTFYSMFINASVIAFMSFRRRTREGTVSFEAVYGDLERGFWPLYKDALKLWPFVNLVAFALFDTLPRMRFLTAANLFWSVYLILMVT
ncbi:hypothetical protein TWF694_000427 [Orbilia ellipsospora]|uniref:Uncharacterized protein n=1 Tax=Orbilia ellipsospora TaxID=2528407 RepID=A0AAV9XNK5_9PEZI